MSSTHNPASNVGGSSASTAKNSTKHVVVVGAGPAGLLLTNLLLERNNKESDSSSQYKVTLIEPRIDVGLLNVETELKAHRSWMIGLANHGLTAIRKVPNLDEDYIQKVGVPIQELSVFLGSKELKDKFQSSGKGSDMEIYCVDRNYIVAALSRYMNDKHGSNPLLDRRYETSVQYVDSANHRVLVRHGKDDSEAYIKNDLLVGADGSRSVVRDSFVRDCYDFETDFGDIFLDFRSVMIEKPKMLSPNGVSMFPECFPHMSGICLPMKDNMVNIAISVPRNKFDDVPQELKSSDPQVVADYARKNFKAFGLADYDDFAEKWIGCGKWYRSAQVHCNRYHNLKGKAVLMGDAAHATSPAIGMGMNTALRDAQKFVELLESLHDNLDKVLPEFTKTRVKEGQSLTDLSYYLYCHDPNTDFMEYLHWMVRQRLSKWFPWLFLPHPQDVIGHAKYSLSDVYTLATKLGIVDKHRRMNDRIRRDMFERQVGMMNKNKLDKFKRNPSRSFWFFTVATIGGAAIAASYMFPLPNLTCGASI